MIGQARGLGIGLFGRVNVFVTIPEPLMGPLGNWANPAGKQAREQHSFVEPSGENAIEYDRFELGLLHAYRFEIGLVIEPAGGVVVSRAIASSDVERHAQTPGDLVEDLPLELRIRRRRLLGVDLPELRVDGGAAANELLMQFQADILGVAVRRNDTAELSAMGAAYLAGLATGLWPDTDAIVALPRSVATFEPNMGESDRARLYDGWLDAVARATLHP